MKERTCLCVFKVPWGDPVLLPLHCCLLAGDSGSCDRGKKCFCALGFKQQQLCIVSGSRNKGYILETQLDKIKHIKVDKTKQKGLHC